MALISFLRNVGAYISTTRRKSRLPDWHGKSRNAISIPIFIINLERNKQRREFSLRRLAGLGFKAEIFPAVEGKKLDIDVLEKNGIYSDAASHEKFSRSLSMSEIGCAWSHLKVYKKILDENIDLALVLEDDAMLVDEAETKLSALIENLPEDCDLMQLIYECKDHALVAPGIVRFHSKECMPVAAAAYLIRNSGARKLLSEGYPIRYPADSIIGRSPRWGTNVYGALPKLAAINNVFPSEIYRERTLIANIRNWIKIVLVRLLG